MTYQKIGPTAWKVAYQRTLVDIKYAKEIFDELVPSIESAKQNQKDYFEKAKTSKPATVQLEARYKLIRRILEHNKCNQIFEIAAGLSPRGLAMTETNPNLIYVELDLPDMTNEKRRILNQIETKFGIRPPNLIVEHGNALDYDSLLKVTKYFEQSNIIVINEGLLRYLNFEQKAIVAQNIHKLLEHFGGIWVTPDITLREVIISASKGAEQQRIMELSGMDIYENAFRDVEHAKEFFAQQGFQVEAHSYTEVEDELVSSEKLGMSKKEVHEAIKHAPVFVMRIA